MRHPWKQFLWWYLSPYGVFALSNPCVTRGSSFVDDFWALRRYLCCWIHASPVEAVSLIISKSHTGCLRCTIHASPIEAVSLVIPKSLEAVWAVEYMRHPWKHFIGDFWALKGSLRYRILALPVKAVSLGISEALGPVCAVESMRYLWNLFRWWILWPLGLFALLNQWVTHRSSFFDNFWVPRGCLGYQIHASLVGAFLLMIFESIGAVWDVESMCHPWQQIRWWFRSRYGLFSLSNPCVTRGRSLIGDFWGPRDCLRYQIHASPVEAVSLINFEPLGAVCIVKSMCHPC